MTIYDIFILGEVDIIDRQKCNSTSICSQSLSIKSMNLSEIKINTFRLFTFCGVTFKQIFRWNNNQLRI